MIAVRVFIYVVVLLLIFGSLKGGDILSVDFFEYLIVVILLGIYTGVVVAFFKKELLQLPPKLLKIGIAFIFLVWGTITVSFLFFRVKVCAGFNPCDLVTIPKILVTLLLACLPIVLILVFRTYVQHKKGNLFKVGR